MSRAEPWQSHEIRAAACGITVGLAVIAVSWWGASGTADENDQVGYVAVGLAGVLLVGAFNGTFLISSRRAVLLRQHAFLGTVAGVFARAPAASSEEDMRRLVAVPGMSLYHLAACQFVHGKDVVAVPSDEPTRLGRRPCGACNP